jgi:UDPglucose 6-dehydrogenase
MSTIAVIGAGYVGTTTAACLAWLGHDVVCADVDAAKVRRLAAGEIPILEEHLEAVSATGLASGRLRFTTGVAASAAAAEFVFLCLPTPAGESGEADLSAVVAACRQIAPGLSDGTVVVNKSTMPVGSARRVEQALLAAGAASGRFSVVSNPEFLCEGSAVRGFLEPDRIVLGADDPETAARVAALYRDVDAPIVVMTPESAEMTKYAANAYLATRLTFVNSIANLCELVGADVVEVTCGMGLDERIGPRFLQPGPGYGGSCLPKDTAALLHAARSAGFDFDMLRSVVVANSRQRDRVVEKIEAQAGGSLAGAAVAVWGLTFKAGTDDLRGSPALDIIEVLVVAGAAVRAYDPVAGDAAARVLGGVDVVNDPYLACKEADVLVVLTEWDEFRTLDFERVRRLMTGVGVVDARNALDAALLHRLGFTYDGVGRPAGCREGRGRGGWIEASENDPMEAGAVEEHQETA